MIISIKIIGPERKRDETLNYKRKREREREVEKKERRNEHGTSRIKMKGGRTETQN